MLFITELSMHMIECNTNAGHISAMMAGGQAAAAAHSRSTEDMQSLSRVARTYA